LILPRFVGCTSITFDGVDEEAQESLAGEERDYGTANQRRAN